jgi:hypothetical protein
LNSSINLLNRIRFIIKVIVVIQTFDMKKELMIGFILLTFYSCNSSTKEEQNKDEENSLSENIALFNGKDLTGWHLDVPDMDIDPNRHTPFVVRNGNLISLGEPGGHLITDQSYSNYRLSFNYRFMDEPGNCGVLVHVSKSRALYDMFPQSIEAQMMHKNAGDFWCIREDIKVSEMEERRGVWVNGDLVNHGFECTANSGQIALQAEGAVVEFNDIILTPITRLSD